MLESEPFWILGLVALISYVSASLAIPELATRQVSLDGTTGNCGICFKYPPKLHLWRSYRTRNKHSVPETDSGGSSQVFPHGEEPGAPCKNPPLVGFNQEVLDIYGMTSG